MQYRFRFHFRFNINDHLMIGLADSLWLRSQRVVGDTRLSESASQGKKGIAH